MINQQRSEGEAVGRGTMRGWGRRADVEKEKAANGSLRVDLMRNGREKLGGKRSEGEKQGRVE